MKRWFRWGSGLFLLSCVGLRRPEAPGVQVVDFETRVVELPSGLRVVLETVPGSATGGAVLVVNAGSADETPEQAGLAHLVEHLVFRSHAVDKPSLFHRLESLGGSAFNGTTGFDATQYFAFVPDKNLQELTFSLATLLSDPLEGVDADDFEHERQIVTNELRLSDENGKDGQALGWLQAAVFPSGHPYAHSVAGSHESLQHLSIDDARKFVAVHYHPPNATLVVSGPYLAPVLRELTEQFGAAPATQPASRARPVPDSDSAGAPKPLASYRAPVASPTLWIGWRLPPNYGADASIPQLLTSMADGSFWGNEYERNRDIANVEAGYEGGMAGSLFYLSVKLNTADDPDAVVDAVKRLVLRGLSERTHRFETFDYFKRALATGNTYQNESVASRALGLADSAHFTGDPLFGRKLTEHVGGLQASRVADFYTHYLAEDRARAILIRPDTQSSPVQGAVGLGTSRGATGAEEEAESLPAVREWMTPPGLADLTRFTLPNGLDVVILARRGTQFHSALLGFDGGINFGVTGAGIAAQWAKYLLRPGPWFRGLAFNERVTEDSSIALTRSTGSNIALTLELGNEASNEYEVLWPMPNFTSRMALFEREDAKPDVKIWRTTLQTLLGEHHPYAGYVAPHKLRTLSAKQVRDWLADVRRPENGVLVLVGDFDLEQAKTAATEEFGRWQAHSQRRPKNAAPVAVERIVSPANGALVVPAAPGTTQATLALACLLPKATPENAPAEEVFGRMLGGFLHDELRERATASYGAVHDIEFWRGGTAIFMAGADLDYGRLEHALSAVHAFLDNSPQASLSQTRLERARSTKAREFDLSLATTDRLARALFRAWRNDWPLDAVDRYPDQLVNVTLAAVQQIADHCRANSVVSLLGDEPRLRAAWAASAAKP
ncbi:MAG TPA: insulinase family protein [Polyangiaceae bacterium]